MVRVECYYLHHRKSYFEYEVDENMTFGELANKILVSYNNLQDLAQNKFQQVLIFKSSTGYEIRDPTQTLKSFFAEINYKMVWFHYTGIFQSNL